MLTQLTIRNLAVVQHLEVTLSKGMIVFSGETGAGKSILMDALGLTLGERFDAGLARQQNNTEMTATTEITAVYDIQSLPHVQAWLEAAGLFIEEPDCIIRRCITEDGRSRAYINGSAVTLAQLKELGEFLVSIHGQHQHHALLRVDFQKNLLDEFGNHFEACQAVKQCYHHLQQLHQNKKELLTLQGQPEKLALLQYQIQELEELNCLPHEIATIEQEHRALTHADSWVSSCEAALLCLHHSDSHASLAASGKNDNIHSLLHQALNFISSFKNDTSKLNTCNELLSQALINVEEATHELIQFKENIQRDPERLQWIDERLSKIHQLARKHRVSPEKLPEHQERLKTEAAQFVHLQETLKEIEEKTEAAEKQYITKAKALTLLREKTASQLELLITEKVKTLEMPHAIIKIQIIPKKPDCFSAEGMEDIEFMVSTNPGLPLQPLRKIASGGELSRLSLAIQVITAEKFTTPTLIFDEVDVGISGKTADLVGDLLRELGEKTQVLCVTHLPQVASKGNTHFKVLKHQSKDKTTTTLQLLKPEDRIQEIARLLGGIKITENTIAHAREMLEC